MRHSRGPLPSAYTTDPSAAAARPSRPSLRSGSSTSVKDAVPFVETYAEPLYVTAQRWLGPPASQSTSLVTGASSKGEALTLPHDAPPPLTLRAHKPPLVAASTRSWLAGSKANR